MMKAYIFIQLGAGASEKTLSGVRGIAGVETVHGLIGPTDAIAYAEVADEDALLATIMAVRAVEGISGTDTRLVWSNL